MDGHAIMLRAAYFIILLRNKGLPMDNLFFPYFDILASKLRLDGPGRPDALSNIEPLAILPYSRELSGKTEAFLEFWKRNRLHGKPEPLIPSPKPRHYRTTTKRRVFFAHGKFRLRFSHHKDATSETAMMCSALEPKEHEAIYQFLSAKINAPGFSISARHLTYIIIRGTYAEFSVLFNVHQLSGPIVRNLKALAQNIKTLGLNIVSSFIFFDPTRSDYYLDNKQTDGAWKLKNLFGPDALKLRVFDQTYRFDPVSFSQINQSMLPALLESAVRLCGLGADDRFIDLYCGYGLFANYVGKRCGEVYAVDSDEASIDRARDTARYTAQKGGRSARLYFRTAPISPASLEKLLPLAGARRETILLDPPRGGPGKGVISSCAQRNPRRVVHLFCDIDRVPVDLQEWHVNGYRVAKIVPFDMFPGTPNLEVAVLLEAMR
jgi:tRNA/tmRNA/rRNA uracil-C5-methylase (TrmA/RlmC/RlmD family)